MNYMNESEVKYLAGLLDADGSLSFKISPSSSGKSFLYLVLGLTGARKIDRDDYILSLVKYGGTALEYTNAAGNLANKWHVQDRTTLNKFLPRVIKHMVIKGKHWDRMFQAYTEMKGQDVTGKEEFFREFSKQGRKDAGPVKAKKHPTWAWIAGYLDGDGCYTFSQKHSRNTLHVGAIAHIDDVVALHLLHKAFGGTVYEEQPDNTRLWRRGLGRGHSAFAKHFLTKVLRHSRLKRHKIERMLAFHSEPQRLNEETPKGEVIV